MTPGVYVVLMLIVLYLVWPKIQTFPGFKHNPSSWIPAAKLIGANEYNRMELHVRNAKTCRDNCTLGCKATEFITDNDGSGNRVCVFFDKFDSYLNRPTAPTDTRTSVWIRS